MTPVIAVMNALPQTCTRYPLAAAVAVVGADTDAVVGADTDADAVKVQHSIYVYIPDAMHSLGASEQEGGSLHAPFWPNSARRAQRSGFAPGTRVPFRFVSFLHGSSSERQSMWIGQWIAQVCHQAVRRCIGLGCRPPSTTSFSTCTCTSSRSAVPF